MAGGPQLVGEGQESVGLTLGMVKEQYLGHARQCTRAPISHARAATAEKLAHAASAIFRAWDECARI